MSPKCPYPKKTYCLLSVIPNGRLNSIFLFGKNVIKVHVFFSCLALPCCLQINQADCGGRSQIMVIVPQDLPGSEKTPSVPGDLTDEPCSPSSTGSCIQRLDGFCCSTAINPSCEHILGLSRQDSISLCKDFQTSFQINLLNA